MFHRRGGHDLATERAEVRREGVGDSLRAAPRDRPPDGVSRDGEKEAERRRAERVERQERVRRIPGEERSRVGPAKSARQAGGGPERTKSEPRHHKRMARGPKRWRQHVLREFVPGTHERSVQLPPIPPARPEPLGGRIERPIEQHGGAVVERVSERGGGLDPLEAEAGQRQGSEEGGAEGEGVYRGADVMGEAGQRERGGAEPAANRRLRLAKQGLESGLRQRDRGR